MTKAIEFHLAMVRGCERSAEFGYYPSYFLREVANVGGVAAVKALMAKRSIPTGLYRLHQEQHLELTCEAFVIAPYYAELFEWYERQWAEHVLREFGFDVDAYLARIGQDAP